MAKESRPKFSSSRRLLFRGTAASEWKQFITVTLYCCLTEAQTLTRNQRAQLRHQCAILGSSNVGRPASQ